MSVAQSWSELEPRLCRALSYSSFLVRSGGSERVGESEGSQRQTEGEEEEEAGLREFAGSLVYSVVVLTSERTPADTGPLASRPCKCGGAPNAVDLLYFLVHFVLLVLSPHQLQLICFDSGSHHN